MAVVPFQEFAAEEAMSSPSILFAAPTISVTLFLFCPVPANGAAFDLICVAERPAVIVGESVPLQALVSTSDGRPVASPIKFEWKVDAGRIEAQGANVLWDLAAVSVESEAVRKVVAVVRATLPEGEQSCKVEVFIGRKDASEPNRGTPQGDLISARHFLLPNGTVPPGFGLYSYLLFSTPPKAGEEESRYLKTIEACLFVMQDVDEYIRRHVRPRDLNTTYIPVNTLPTPGRSNSEWAANVLAAYDYSTASILLKYVRQSHEQGPYLVSVLQPIEEHSTTAYLFEDLSGVVPELAWDWVRFFTYLAAQQRSWSEETLGRFGLRLRNLIAVGGKVTPDVLDVLPKAIQFTPKS
jgi:hypothetical protein